MNQPIFNQREQLPWQLGVCEERVRRMQKQLDELRAMHQTSGRDWRRLLQFQADLAEWLIEQATNEAGKVVTSVIDARLGGESFVPCSFTATANGRRYEIELISTNYRVREVPVIG